MTVASGSGTRVFRTIHPRSKSGPVAGRSWLTIQAAAKESTVGIEVRDLSKRYGTFQAIKDVSFEVIAGQLVALLGPSGSGKSTILRIIAGLEVADTGSVVLTGEDATRLPVQDRGVGFVFQHYALFRHMTVRNNIAFGLKVRKLPKSEIKTRVDELLELVQLTGYAGRYPSQLSGGQRQRVALARALAPRPKVLLLDEPFGALDAKVRDELRVWLRKLHDEVHVTSLFVTHDQREAFEVADQIVVLNEGKVQQVGPPQSLYLRPSSPFVAQFLGQVNILPLETIQLGSRSESPFNSSIPGLTPQSDAQIYVRPHDLEVQRERNGRPCWSARVERVTPLGGVVRMDLSIEGDHQIQLELISDPSLDLNFAPGDTVFVTPRHINVFDARSHTFHPVVLGHESAMRA
jgi:sulfate/thiosulfate transport system ATP-binding protein